MTFCDSCLIGYLYIKSMKCEADRADCKNENDQNYLISNLHWFRVISCNKSETPSNFVLCITNYNACPFSSISCHKILRLKIKTKHVVGVRNEMYNRCTVAVQCTPHIGGSQKQKQTFVLKPYGRSQRNLILNSMN